MNAVKLGLYSKELYVSEADKPEFEQMRAGLMAQLPPRTMLQGLAFDYYAVCQWRVKLALRLEHSQFASLFQDKPPETKQGEAPDVVPVMDRWYGCSRADTKAGIRTLDFAITEFEGHGVFRDETRKFLITGFGPHFVSLLEEWKTPMNLQAILMANHYTRHLETYGETPTMENDPPSPRYDATKVVIDPMQGRHMVRKLLEERRNFLKEFLWVTDHRTLGAKADAAEYSDFNPRFLSDANRELRRALDWYIFLQDNDL